MTRSETPTDAIRLEYGRTYFVRTTAVHVFSLPPDWMTIAFLCHASAPPEDPFPRYVLRSTDGAYTQTRSAKDDLVPGDAWLQLVFERLLPGREYVLERFDDDDRSTVVFERLPFARIVDQPRAMHDGLRSYGYVAADVELQQGDAFEDWG